MDRSGLLGRLADEGLHAEPWSNGPGARYEPHSHTYDKVLVVSQGAIVFGLTGRGESAAMSIGDRLDLPAGMEHDANVGPLGVECLEAHVAAGTLTDLPRLRMAGDW
jgi:quercetin dioxygenase-like cupin family protein